MSYLTYQGKKVSFGGSANVKMPSLNTGLVGYWNLDEPSGLVAYDSTGNCDGTRYGSYQLITDTNGIINNCKYFSSTNDVVVLNNSSTIQQLEGKISFSVSLWFKLNNLPSTVGNSLGLFVVQGNTWPLTISIAETDYYNVRYAYENDYDYLTQDLDISINEWHHFATVISQGDYAKFYIDGSLKYTSTGLLDSSFNQGSSNAYIGPSNWGADHYVDEVGLWKRALSSTEILQLYNSGIGKTYPFTEPSRTLLDSIKAYWKFDESSGTTAFDSVSNYHLDKEGSTYITTTGKINNANVFIKTTDIIDSSYGSLLCDNSPAWSISFWAYLDRIPSVAGHRYYLWFSQPGYRTIEIRNSDFYQDKILVTCYDDTDNYEEVASATVTNNTWYHIVVVAQKNDKLKLYVNNTLYESTGILVSNLKAATTNGHFQFGAGSTNYLEGRIDESGVWNRALSSYEVAQLYNSGNGKSHPFGVIPKVNLLDSIVSYWTLDETQGSIIYDKAGKYNCTYQNIALGANGKINYAPQFNPSNGVIIMPSTIDTPIISSGKFSVSMWVKFDSLVSTLGRDQGLFVIGGSGPFSGIEIKAVYTFRNCISYYIWTTDGAIAEYSSELTATSSFIHIVLTYGGIGDRAYFYINGVLDSSSEISVAPIASLGVTHSIGNVSQYNYNAMNGIIDEVALWNRALSANDVSALYAGGFGNTYPFNKPKYNVPSVLFDGSTVGWYIYDTEITSTDSSVSKWSDVLGTGRDLEASTNVATWPKVDANGVSFLQVDNELTDSFSYISPCFVYAVIKQNSWTDGNTIFNSPAGPRVKQTTPSPGIWAYQGSWGLNNNDFTLGEWKILRWQLNGANSKIICNNGIPSINNAVGGSLNGFYIGSLTVAANVSYKEIILRRGDSPAQESAIYNYLATKYNIS